MWGKQNQGKKLILDDTTCPSQNSNKKPTQTYHQHNRQEWINACREANEAINEAKVDSWKEVLVGAMPTPTTGTCGKS